MVWGLTPAELRIWQGGSWGLVQAQTQNLDQIGVNTSADSTNRLALAADASLFSHAGLGTASPSAHLEIAGTGSDYLLAGDGGGTGFRLAADGNGSCESAWSGSGADYAEWFEWLDGNPAGEDRRRVSVVLEGACIRPARADEDPIGVVSAAPAVIGDGDMDEWKQRWLRDDFGAPLLGPGGARRENPAYDPSRPYQPRSQRPEWGLVGLLGKLRLRAGQPHSACWLPMRQISGEIEEWLLR